MSELPDFVNLPLKTMDDVDEIEAHLQDAATSKRLVSRVLGCRTMFFCLNDFIIQFSIIAIE